MDIASRLANKFKEKEEKIVKKTEVNYINKINIKEILCLEQFRELTSNEELYKILIEGTEKLFKIQVKNTIELGSIFYEIFEQLSRKKEFEGFYEKWLDLNKINKRTALRYRKRFEVFKNTNKENQYIVASLPQKYIEIIFENKELIEVVNKENNIKEIVNILEDKYIKNEKILGYKDPLDINQDINISKYKFLSPNIKNTLENLDEENKKKIKTYFEKINKILEK